MRNVLLAALLSVATPAEAAPPQSTLAPAPAQSTLSARKPLTYAEGYRESMKTGKPLLVFVGQPVKEIRGCISCEGGETFSNHGKGVILSRPGSDGLYRVKTVLGTPGAGDIEAALLPDPPKVSAPAPVSYFQPTFAPSFRGGSC